MTSRTDQNGDTTSYSYDDMHRLTGRSYTVSSGTTYPSSQGPDAFGYDRTGRMISADREYGSADIELDLAYDKANRVTSVTESGYALAYAYTLNTSNDYRDVTYPDGRVIREQNDLRGRVDTIVDRGAGGTGTPVTLADNAYDLNNRQTSRAFPNYVTGTWTYDDAGRVSGVEHVLTPPSPGAIVTIADVAYGRDDVGNPLYRQDLQTTTHSEKYWYDDANRLTEFKRGTLNTGKTDVTTYTSDASLTQRNAWTLDKLGNWDEFLKRNNDTEITEPRTNNKANEYLTIDPDGSGGASPLTLAHDGNGNLTDDGTYTYEYDIENRMTRVKAKSGGATLADYHYDALGRRIRKIIPSGTDAGTWTYVVNELWQVFSEYKTVSSTTTHQRRYVHAGQSAYVDDHVAMWDIVAGKLFYYHADAQYCTVAMSYTAGAVEERYVTDPYGKAVTYNGSWGSPQATSRIGNPFMHQGLWLDGECGKYQNRHREFLPTLGQFAQRDPLGYKDGADLVAYVKGNPALRLDPKGQMATCPPDDPEPPPPPPTPPPPPPTGPKLPPANGGENPLPESPNSPPSGTLPIGGFGGAVDGGDITPTSADAGCGQPLMYCIRKAELPAGNHAYLWDPCKEKACGEGASSGSGFIGENPGWDEDGPYSPGNKKGDCCVPIPGSEHKIPHVMQCCKKTANEGPWIPYAGDCHNRAKRCLRDNHLPMPNLPVERFGDPDWCKH